MKRERKIEIQACRNVKELWPLIELETVDLEDVFRLRKTLGLDRFEGRKNDTEE